MTDTQKNLQSQHSSNRKLIVLAVIAVLIALFFGYQMSQTKQAAPQLNYTNIQGKTIATQALQGKVYMVNFWATSCATCIKEMPEMIASYEKFRAQGLEYFAVAMSYDPPNYVLNFTETRKLPFHVVLDLQGKIAQAFGDVRLTPTTFVIDKQGKIIKRYVGEPSFDELNQLLATELAKT